jgi:hypothetical protein
MLTWTSGIAFKLSMSESPIGSAKEPQVTVPIHSYYLRGYLLPLYLKMEHRVCLYLL